MKRPRYHNACLLAVVLALGSAACGGDDLPEPGTEAYVETVGTFYAGLAAVEVGEDRIGEEKLLLVTEQAPDEPATWANLGLLALRRNDYELAAERLDRARALAPENAHVLLLSGLLESSRSAPAAAISYFRDAIAQDSANVKALYALANVLDEDGEAAEAQRLLEQALAVRPRNVALRLTLARRAAQAGEASTLRALIEPLVERSGEWPEAAQAPWQTLREAASAGEASAAERPLAVLQNILLRERAYREDLAEIATPIEQVGELVTQFIRLPRPSPNPAPPDDSLAFDAENIPTDLGEAAAWVGAVSLAGDDLPALVVSGAEAVQVVGAPEEGGMLAFPGGEAGPGTHAVASLDYDYDFRTDLAVAGVDGLKLYRQDSLGVFSDVTAAMALPPGFVGAAYSGVWAADLDLEGDLDLILASENEPPRFARNNGDGTFAVDDYFEAKDPLRDFAWADFDGDGDPDAALLQADGRLRIYRNDRNGRFNGRGGPDAGVPLVALAVADLDRDARLDLAALAEDGSLHHLTFDPVAGSRAERIAEWEGGPAALKPAEAHLFAQDFDNNGGVDLLAATPSVNRLWLDDPAGGFLPLDVAPGVRLFDAADLTGDGRLDLVGIDGSGTVQRFVNRGVKPYHWKQVRPRAATALGDQRINSFGIGGEVELRAGVLFQKRAIQEPIVHFGLGEYLVADVARIIWPNGDVQAEFDLLSDEAVAAQQRLKGSCPWVFTYDGETMRFVTDFLWRSPLGLRINAQETAGIMTTEDWVKIPGEMLVPRDGVYDLRITAELWETHFFDHVSLLVVDHPEDVEVFVDERFAFPPPPLAVHAMTKPQPVARAWDDHGDDVTDRIRARDARFLDTFGRGRYQGITREHFVEIELGDDAPPGPLYLLASGWIRPTDSSINVALGQGAHGPPQGIRLEVPDGNGGWAVAAPNLGFPSGKEKTILIDLTEVFLPETPRRLRLRTNLEIFWDAFAWAVPRPEAELRTRRLAPATATLRYRGFSDVREQDRSSPEIPDYGRLDGTGQVWRDLVGYYTRFGDVRELLAAIDDRYVIMNAGDEMAFGFAAPEAPPPGWRRDFVLVGDGWVKDGDYNTTFSTTVLPLPAHDQPTYTTPPGRLEDDPVYQRYPEDWQTYHTRYVTPERFGKALQ